jgi:wobble nucleotide-excising tRNase
LLYKEEPVEKDFLKNIDVLSFSKLVKKEIFKKEIVENKDIKLSKLIEDLNNSKWVEEGISYLKESNKKCPFCQQELMPDFIEKIYNLYDEKYKEEKEEFYSSMDELNQRINYIKNIIVTYSTSINNSKLIADINNYFDNIANELNKKNNSLKYCCKFPEDIDLLNKLYEVINELNEEIKINNDKIKSITDSRINLINNSWDYIRNICNEYITDFLDYNKKNNIELEKQDKELKEITNVITDINTKIKELENSITSITKTITQINETLKKFNYTNFKLTENPDHLTYSIIRENGEDASKNLSEGEFNFISFLYFYNLIFGSRTRSGLEEDHILVIDDPVTSMDSNALFIISTLIRNLIDLCLDEKRHIKQIYILSHNLYFFKEVTYGYDEKSRKSIKNNVQYFTICKLNGISKIKSHENVNPIKTSYEILWNKLREKNYKDDSIQNTMRRILEQFLKTIGMGGPNNNNKELIKLFDDKDKYVVKSLLSYINDGSHSIMDGLYVSQDERANESAFNIFREIFVKLGFEDHYKMMMNEYDKDE